jgi:hypothetical protein
MSYFASFLVCFDRFFLAKSFRQSLLTHLFRPKCFVKNFTEAKTTHSLEVLAIFGHDSNVSLNVGETAKTEQL